VQFFVLAEILIIFLLPQRNCINIYKVLTMYTKRVIKTLLVRLAGALFRCERGDVMTLRAFAVVTQTRNWEVFEGFEGI
jgi:hypothetical protein